MRIRSRLRQLEQLAKPSTQHRTAIQVVGADGTAKPTDEEVERQMAEWEAEGIEPRLIQVQIVRAGEV